MNIYITVLVQVNRETGDLQSLHIFVTQYWIAINRKCLFIYPSNQYFLLDRRHSEHNASGGLGSTILGSMSLTGHFRVLLCLSFQTSFAWKLFIWKLVWFAWKWTCRLNLFSYQWLHTKTCFDTEAKGNSEMTYFVFCLFFMSFCQDVHTANITTMASFLCRYAYVIVLLRGLCELGTALGFSYYLTNFVFHPA